jgi:uncharacterized protein YecE (DUF72 family)
VTGSMRIGISGWSYDHWRGRFYPSDLPRSAELAYAVAAFDTIEINRTFYSLVTSDAFQGWRDASRPGFKWAVKGSRFITHTKRLGDVAVPLANFFASGVSLLGPTLGPILWQLPATMVFDPERLDAFLALLPHDTDDMRRLAARHDDRVADTELGGGRHLVRHVLEPRHESFFVPDAARLARRHGVALAFSHSSRWPYAEEVTAGFVYLRLHGPDRLYDSAYSDEGIRRWAERVAAWAAGEEPPDPVRITDRRPPERKGRDVYVYFDNDGQGLAPRQALALRAVLGSR